MKNFFVSFQIYKVPAILLALFIFGLWYLSTSTEEQSLKNKQEISSTKGTTDTKVSPLLAKSSEEIAVEQSEETGEREINAEKFSFENEAKKVQELIRQWPASHGELLEVVVQADLFKEQKKPIDPHSLDEIQQNQMGAIKVLALRELIKQDRDPLAIMKDLDYIVQRAQDPTIVKIATAAKESLVKGRSFFDDFVGGIESLEIE